MRSLNSLITVLALSFSTLAAVGCATTGDETDVSEIEDEAAAAGKISLWQDSNGQYHFNLKSGNGAILLSSEAYTNRSGAINGSMTIVQSNSKQSVSISTNGGGLSGVTIGLSRM